MTFVFISSEIVSFQMLLQWLEEVQGHCYKIEGQDIPRETAPRLVL
jgi:type II secretory pathway component PulM